MSTLAGLLALAGALFALAGSLGLLTLGSFYERVHPPTLGTTFGSALLLAACAIHSSSVEGRLVLHFLLIGVFMTLTTPVTFVVLMRAALHRDAAEGRDLLAPVQRTPTGPVEQSGE
jgi:multicomponent K+:H+ antiporter subunit G